ncbi:MAG TPA: hypothetical protein PKK06_15865 [Phycisphaerae bacterium]|nr:hypothetical protein [Phycisphaerae bacterium]HNU47027.1 hypothetical protein [Phycisphaerae bacterium]
MLNIRKHLVTDEANRPIAVQIDYEDWCRIEQVLGLDGGQKAPTDLAEHLGKLDWPVDGLRYQQEVRGEWE